MSDYESESIEIGPPDVFGQAYVQFLNTDAGFYHLQEQNECNLCRLWAKSIPGSDERLLAIEDDMEFMRTTRLYRTRTDGRALWDERMRRERSRRERARRERGW